MSQAKRARGSELRVARMPQAKGAGPPQVTASSSAELEDASGERGQGIFELRVARMPQAKGAGPPQVTASSSAELEDVSGETGQTIPGQGISEPRVARMSQARLAGLPQVTAFGSSELGGCLMRKSVLKGGEGSSVREAIVAHVAHSQQHSSAQHSTAEQDPSQHSCFGNPANGIQSRL